MSGNQRQVRATARFLRDMLTEARHHPEFLAIFQNFVDVKIAPGNPENFGRKDAELKSPLRGVLHCHLLFGECIVFYAVSEDYLSLYRVGNHSITDSTENQKVLRKLVNRYLNAEEPYLALPLDEEFLRQDADLENEEISDVEKLRSYTETLYFFAVETEYRVLIESAIAGNDTPLSVAFDDFHGILASGETHVAQFRRVSERAGGLNAIMVRCLQATAGTASA